MPSTVTARADESPETGSGGVREKLSADNPECEWIETPDGCQTTRVYVADRRLRFESILDPGNSMIERLYYDNGQLQFEWVSMPDGEWRKKEYYDNGQPKL